MSDTMFRAVGEIGGDLISDADEDRVKKHFRQKRRKIWLRCVSIAACLPLIVCLCIPNFRVSATELSKGYERKADGGTIDAAFPGAMADFSISLFQGLVTKDGNNDLVSPLSAVICLAMIANGAEGETKAQLEAALGLDIDTLNRSLYAYTSSLYRADDCKLNLADSVWFRNGENRFRVNEEFLQTNADWFDAQVYAAPFNRSTQQDINNWCKKYTDGKIDKIVDSIDADAVMYLINALTFDAKWAEAYKKSDIRDAVFTNYDGMEKSVPMLSSNENVYLSAEDVTGFAKRYAGGHYCLIGLLPDEGIDLYDYIASLDGARWTALWNSRKSASVAVKMPEFSYSAEMKLNNVLEEMGVTEMFGAHADFSKLGYSEYGNIHCSEVCQKTFIEVDRNGTKAAAITRGTMDYGMAAPNNEFSVVLDRPFVYAIVDSSTGIPLFIGAVSAL